MLFSIRGDFGLEGPATSSSWFRGQGFPSTTGEIKPSLTFSLVLCWSFLLFWLLVVDIFVEKFDLEELNFSQIYFLIR